MSDDLVYRLIKIFYEYQKEKEGIHPQAKQWSLQNTFRTMDYVGKYMSFHPGVVRYLKEKGVWKEKS